MVQHPTINQGVKTDEKDFNQAPRHGASVTDFTRVLTLLLASESKARVHRASSAEV